MGLEIEKVANCLRRAVIGAVIMEYAQIELVDGTKQELKSRVKNAISASRKVQSYFLTHSNSTPEYNEIFKKEFLRNEILLIGELLETVWGLSEDDLEVIINSIKDNTDYAG